MLIQPTSKIQMNLKHTCKVKLFRRLRQINLSIFSEEQFAKIIFAPELFLYPIHLLITSETRLNFQV